MIKNLPPLLLLIYAYCSWIPSLWADLLPVPQSAPSSIPYTAPRGDTISLPKQKIPLKEKISNTPADSYILVKKGKSIEVYEDTLHQVFIQRVHFGSGARVTSIFDFHSFDSMNGEPLYSRFSPSEKIKSLKNPPFSFINGQFFDPKKRYTPFSFGFKTKDTVLTTGADNGNEGKNIFSFSSSGVRIREYSWENLRDEPADFALVNLQLSQGEYDDLYMGRTYLCVLSPDTTGYSHTVLSFTFLAAKEEFARDTLYSWGCRHDSISQLDSSGSSIFGFEKKIFYGYSHRGFPDYRKIPHIIAFYDD